VAGDGVTLPPALERARTDRLAPAGFPGPPAPTRRAPVRRVLRRARTLAGRALRSAEARGLLADRAAVSAATHRLGGVEATLRDLRPVAVDQALLRGQLEQVDARLAGLADQVAGLSDRVAGLADATGRVGTDISNAAVNQELQKGEFRALLARVEELGSAIAPAAGLAGAAERMAELRERVNGLDRRLRALAANPSAALPPPAPAQTPPAAGGRFDYVGFERRFRGDPVEVERTLWDRYGERLAERPPVVDLGCGRGELLVRLAGRGVPGVGVDTDAGMVAEARARGLDVHHADALSWLRGQPDATLGSIVSTHLVEHLELDDLVELLELSAAKLCPGGLFVAETPNPSSLIVLGNSYVLDPTHVRPLHASLLVFLCEGAGFREVTVEFYAPAEGYRLQLVADPAAPAWVGQVNAAFAQLNSVLFGPQDYAVVAVTPPTPASR
jgi:SAM-dependent methyltransferase